MDVTKKCTVSGKYGFNPVKNNKYVIFDVDAKNGDLVKVNKVNGITYSELWGAYEYPPHEEHPIIDNENKIIIVGGEQRETKRTICVIGR